MNKRVTIKQIYQPGERVTPIEFLENCGIPGTVVKPAQYQFGYSLRYLVEFDNGTRWVYPSKYLRVLEDDEDTKSNNCES